MAQNVAPRLERLVEHFLPVKANEIEASFDDIWREASSGALDSSSVRLRVSNVLTWGLEEEATERFELLMDGLAQLHPCRGILAAIAENGRNIESAISAHCWRTAGGGKHICSEEILLRASSKMQAELASAVLALLVPELPVHLWLVGDPDPLRRIPDEIFEVADRLYVDSAAGAATSGSLVAIQSAAASDSARVIDLAWQRLEPWREVTAQLFDGPSGVLLDQISSIEIAGGAEGASAAGLLHAGWLASRLDLTMAAVEAAANVVVATFYDGSRPVTVRVAPSSDGAELAGLVIRAGDATMSVELHATSGHMHVRSDWAAEPVHRTVAAEAVDDPSVVARALHDQTEATIYDAALRLAIALTD